MTSAHGWDGGSTAGLDGDQWRHRSPARGGDSSREAWADVVSTFGGVVLLISAGMGALQGMSAIANDDLYSQGSDYLYAFDMQVWGTVHLLIAILSAIVAVGVLAQRAWGYVGGLVAAGLSVLGNFAFLPYYPLWSLTLIALGVLIIWSLLVRLAADR